MARRILAAGLGGLAGFVLWYVLISPLAGSPASDRAIKLSMSGLAVCVLGCGLLVMALGQKLRIIPSQEEVDKKSKPVSLFSTDEPRRESGPKPEAPALSSNETKPAAPLPEPDKAAVDEIHRRSAQILAASTKPEFVYIAGEPGGFLTFKPGPNQGPAVLLFTTPYAAVDYIRAVRAKAEVRQINTAELPDAARNWISIGATGFILNRCPRCSVCLLGDLKSLLAGDAYFKIWAIDRATRTYQGEIQVHKMMAHFKMESLAEARTVLEVIRDHIDCGIPYVYQLIAYIAGTQEDVAVKSAACERLKEFGPQFEWSPEHDRFDKDGDRADILVSATVGLLGSFGMLPTPTDQQRE